MASAVAGVFVVATTADGTRAALTAGVPLARGSRARHAAVFVTMLSLLGAPRTVAAQTPDTSTQNPPASEPSPLAWQYGGFVDVGYLRDFNDPSNYLFRSRGTAFHVNEWDVNMHV